MDQRRLVRISMYLAKHLRHEPERIGLVLDPNGWVDVDDLLAAAAANGFPITAAELAEVVARNDKQRYAIENGRIRASQGHTVPVDLDVPPAEPPALLHHGTVAENVIGIRARGLLPMARQHVHLSPDAETAARVGARRGKPVILTIRASTMHSGGYVFYRSANGVWLVSHVPPSFIRFPGAKDHWV